MTNPTLGSKSATSLQSWRGLSDSDDDGGSELGDNRSDGAGLDRGRFANDDLESCGASAPMTMAADYDSGNDGLQ
jgi:hypothetical protein